jgi:carbonyl reductase 1
MTRTAVITGANQGLGLALVQALATRWTATDRVLLTGRATDRVNRAAESVRATGVSAAIEPRRLDVTDRSAVAALAAELGAVDVVVSNATARLSRTDDPALRLAEDEEFVAVANGGTDAVLRAFAPVLRSGGRLIVVASALGTLDHLDPRLRPLLAEADLDEVAAVVADWRAAARTGTAADRGWPAWANVPSKVAQVAAVRAVAAQRRATDLRTDTLIAAVCPGLVDTPTSRPWFDDFSQARTPAAAAAAVLDFVLAPVNPTTYGQLVRDGKPLPWLPA